MDCKCVWRFDEQYIAALVNEFKGEEFIDMDTKYFDKQNIRLKAESVDEKNLFGLYYDYDSSFEHGLWGAIIKRGNKFWNQIYCWIRCI